MQQLACLCCLCISSCIKMPAAAKDEGLSAERGALRRLSRGTTEDEEGRGRTEMQGCCAKNWGEGCEWGERDGRYRISIWGGEETREGGRGGAGRACQCFSISAPAFGLSLTYIQYQRDKKWVSRICLFSLPHRPSLFCCARARFSCPKRRLDANENVKVLQELWHVQVSGSCRYKGKLSIFCLWLCVLALGRGWKPSGIQGTGGCGAQMRKWRAKRKGYNTPVNRRALQTCSSQTFHFISVGWRKSKLRSSGFT